MVELDFCSRTYHYYQHSLKKNVFYILVNVSLLLNNWCLCSKLVNSNVKIFYVLDFSAVWSWTQEVSLILDCDVCCVGIWSRVQPLASDHIYDNSMWETSEKAACPCIFKHTPPTCWLDGPGW